MSKTQQDVFYPLLWLHQTESGLFIQLFFLLKKAQILKSFESVDWFTSIQQIFLILPTSLSKSHFVQVSEQSWYVSQKLKSCQLCYVPQMSYMYEFTYSHHTSHIFTYIPYIQGTGGSRATLIIFSFSTHDRLKGLIMHCHVCLYCL